MRARFILAVAFLTACTGLATGRFANADEREEIKLRIVEIKRQAAELFEQGRKDKAQGLLREQEELLKRLDEMNTQERFEERGPHPEAMEKLHKAMEQVHHLRVASEHLKHAGMHDMAMDLMRRAEGIEADLRNAKEKMEVRRDHPDRPRPESRAPEKPGPEGFMEHLQIQIDQLRNENRELRAMVEKIANAMKQMNQPQIHRVQPDRAQVDKAQVETRMLQFAERSVQRADKDKNGVLTPDEFKSPGAGFGGATFEQVDLNKDGKIDVEEYAKFRASR